MVSGRGFGTNRKINEKIIEKRIKNHGKMVSKFIEKLILFRICDSLFFFKESYVKMRFLQNQGYRKDGKIDEKTMQKGGCQKVGKSMPKGTPKVIVDAERHRRTPRLSATSGKAICVRVLGLTQADSMREAGRNWRRLRLKS